MPTRMYKPMMYLLLHPSSETQFSEINDSVQLFLHEPQRVPDLCLLHESND